MNEPESSPPPFWPAFGVYPHTPASCRELAPGLKDDRGEVKRIDRSRGEACPACGSTREHSAIAEWSWAYCPACHAVAPGKARIALSHSLASLTHDRRKGPPKRKPKPKPKKRKKSAKPAAPFLTAKQRAAMLRDAKAGEFPPGVAEAFLKAIESPSRA